MAVHLERLDPAGTDRDELVGFLVRETFPFHVRPRLGADDVRRRIDAGGFRDDATDTFWVVDDAVGHAGVVVLTELTDPIPLLDLRLAAAARGRGIGTGALRAVAAHLFTGESPRDRLEGQTRADNVAMRRAFVRCGWVKEAHYRDAWPVEGGAPVASIAYGLLRRDWETGTSTPVPWDDEP